ncbi:cytochrome p450 domain-containing protein [Ditylenchus destructor]|nr:cytochrome p450 domain-containing protein [Ditylenchus destructor]
MKLVIQTIVHRLLRCLHYESTYFERRGIKSPKGNILYGSSLEVLNDTILFDLRNLQQLGTKHFGAFVFGRKELTTIDLDLLKEVGLRNFSHFTDKFSFVGHGGDNGVMANILDFLPGDDWKRVRASVTPVFTASKLRKLLPLINQCTEKCFGLIGKHIESGEKMDIRIMLGRVSIDVAGQAGFSLDVNPHNEKEESLFLKQTQSSLDGIVTGGLTGWKALAATLCPFLINKMKFMFDINEHHTHKFLNNFMDQMYTRRMSEPLEQRQSKGDIFQHLMDVVEEEEECLNDDGQFNGGRRRSLHDLFSFGSRKPSIAPQMRRQSVAGIAPGSGAFPQTMQRKRSMSKPELFSQAFLVFVSGYDSTVPTTLRLILYMLALHPEVQQRLYEEIEEVMGDEVRPEVRYEHLQQLKYLEQVIQETLRMYPVAPRVNRECVKEITIDGIEFQPGDIVNIPIYAIHHNPDYFPEPEKFDPDRFSPDEMMRRDPLAYIPFGFGPRSCIGMRFAQFQIRVIIVRLIKKFVFERAEGSPVLPLKLECGELVKPIETLYVNVHHRKTEEYL